MRAILISLFILLFSFSYSHAVTMCYYVDPDAAGANDGGRDGADPNDPSQSDNWTDAWTSLNAAESALDGVALATRTYRIYCRSSAGTDDTTQAYFYGWTNNPPIEVYGYDFPTNGKWDDTKYVLSISNSIGIICRQSNVIFDSLQIKATCSSSATDGILIYSKMTGIIVRNCIVTGDGSGSFNFYGIENAATAKIQNCIVYNFDYDFKSYGIYSSGISDVNNCTIWKCYYGARENGGTCQITNSVIGNCSDDVYSNTITLLNCAIDDDADTHTGRVDLNENASGEWTNSFTSYGTGNFSIKDTSSPLYNTGTDLTGFVSDDIIGTERPQVTSYDIGAFEYIVPAPSEPSRRWPRIININMN